MNTDLALGELVAPQEVLELPLLPVAFVVGNPRFLERVFVAK